MNLALFVLLAPALVVQAQTVVSGRRYQRLALRNAMVVDGNGTPASGPKDILIEGDTIADVVPLDPVALQRGDAKRPAADVEIDAQGKYVLPGLINAHAHVHEKRGHDPLPVEYVLKLWLACGITTVRDVGSGIDAAGERIDLKKLVALREQSRKGEVTAPRIFAYSVFQAYGLLRELELHQEAGFHPLQILQHATGNNAKILGQAERLGRVRAGWAADLLVVNGNPLENLKVLYPPGIEWTIKDGLPYHGPTVLAEVKELVARARRSP